MTPRPPHIRDRMLTKIAQQIAALPNGGAWQLDGRLAWLLGCSNISAACRLIECELRRSWASVDIQRTPTHAVVNDRELQPIAIFHRPCRPDPMESLRRIAALIEPFKAPPGTPPEQTVKLVNVLWPPTPDTPSDAPTA